MKTITSLKKATLALMTLALSLCLALGTTVSAFAADGTYVKDSVGALTSDQKASLNKEAADMSSATGIGVYLYYVSDVGSSSSREYAKNIYKKESLGLGDGKNGILFLVAVNSRDYVTVTYGTGVNAFTDAYISDMESDIKSKLSGNNWYEAGQVYLTDAERAVSYYAENGSAYTEPANPLISFVIALVVALILASIVVKSQKAKMKTAVAGTEADDYLDDDSFSLSRSDDQYQGTIVICIKSHQEKERERHQSSVDSQGFGGSHGGKF